MDQQALSLVPGPVGSRDRLRRPGEWTFPPQARPQTLANRVLSQIEPLGEAADVFRLAHGVGHRPHGRNQLVDDAHPALNGLGVMPQGRHAHLVLKDWDCLRQQVPEPLRTFCPEELVGIAGRQHDHQHRKLRLLEQRHRPLHRRLTGCVGVVHEHGLAGEPFQHQHLFHGQRRAQ